MSRELSELLGSMGAGVIRLLLVVVAAIAAAVDAGPTAGPDWHEQSAGESKAKTSRSATPIPPGFGPQQVWRLSRAATAELHRCTDPISVDCVQRVMERHGGSAGALEFYRRTGWLLSKLKVTGGPVMLATVVNPWRANENEQPALLSGNSVVVYPEEVEVPLENDAGFKALKAEFPKLMFWNRARRSSQIPSRRAARASSSGTGCWTAAMPARSAAGRASSLISRRTGRTGARRSWASRTTGSDGV